MQLHLNKRFEWKELPDMQFFKSEIDRQAKDITIGETLFFKEHGVKTEGEYKKKAMAEGFITKHSHIGWNSWDETARNLEYIFEELTRRGSYMSRMGLICDWVMGVPREYRDRLIPGTGLILNTPEEWRAVGQVVPIQPHMSDHMLGCPNALENVKMALNAGVTSIGNVSHYFTYEYPNVDLEYDRTYNSVIGFGLMGKFDGCVIHSNLDDGYGNQFHDLANLTGWTMMERYLVETLLGGQLSLAYGNLFSDPISRIVFNMACDATNTKGAPGTMTFGNTIDYGLDLSKNYGALANFSLADAICQIHKPTGHAVASVPVTEAMRVPTPDEIVDGHLVVDMMIEKARMYEPYMDWKRIEEERDLLVSQGKIFFERIMNALDDLGVDTEHAGEVFAAVKAIGARQLEDNFGVGEQDKAALGGRRPVRPTDIVKTLQEKQKQYFQGAGDILRALDGYRLIVGSTDIHEYGKDIAKAMCLTAGAEVFDLGTYVTAHEIVDNVLETECRAVFISTFNGVALSFAKEVLTLLKDQGLDDVTLVLGGALNENMDGSMLAVDVTEQLEAMGVNVENDLNKTVEIVRKIYES